MKLWDIVPFADKEADSGDLKNFISVLDHVLDQVSTETENLGKAKNALEIDSKKLPDLAADTGIEVPLENITVGKQRKIVFYGNRLLRMKGTPDALRFMIYNCLGYENAVSGETNLKALDRSNNRRYRAVNQYDDDFMNSIGTVTDRACYAYKSDYVDPGVIVTLSNFTLEKIIRDDNLPDQTGAGLNEVILDVGASSTDDYYNGHVIEIDGGTGSGQRKRIIDYDGSTKKATVDSNWTIQPDDTSDYIIGTIDDGKRKVLEYLIKQFTSGIKYQIITN